MGRCSYWAESNDCLYLVGSITLMALRRRWAPRHDFIDCMHIDSTQSIITGNFQSSCLNVYRFEIASQQTAEPKSCNSALLCKTKGLQNQTAKEQKIYALNVKATKSSAMMKGRRIEGSSEKASSKVNRLHHNTFENSRAIM